MSKPETDTVTVRKIIDAYRVHCGETNKVVNGVKIAGCEITMPFSGEFEVECTEWAIEGEYDPYLLIESAEWYSEPED